MESSKYQMLVQKIAAVVLAVVTAFTAILISDLQKQNVKYEDIVTPVAQTESVDEVIVTEDKAPVLTLSYMGMTLPEVDTAVSQSEREHVITTAVLDTRFITQVLVNVSESLNIRESASGEAPIIGKMYKGAGGRLLERSNGWTKVQSGSVEGWVSDEFLIFGKDIESAALNMGLVKATVITETLKVRQDANEESAVLGLISQNQSFTFMEEQEKWIKIAYAEGVTGYVSADYVDVQVAFGKAVTLEEEEAARKAAEQKEEAKKSKMSASEEEIAIMAACVSMEAGGYTYEGQLAVANVILNRVRSGKWGGSIKSVIYAPGQFPGASNGLLNKHLAKGPSASVMRAVRDALNGSNNIGDYMFFNSTRAAKYGSYKQYVVVDGNCFYKK